MRRTIIAAAGLAAAATLLPTPAYAALTDREARSVGVGIREGSVISTVHYDPQNDGSGYIVRKIEIECVPRDNFEGDMQVRTDALALFVRDGGDKKWSQPDGNIVNGCHREWTPDVRIPERGASLHWDGKARINNGTDDYFDYWNAGPYGG